jgi:zinc protease
MKRLDAAVWGRVGEVPVVWQETPGPVIAALGFRVGRADEPLARSGLTHLVEHLTLSGLGERLYDYDGFVNGTMTWFGFRGTPGELAEYLGHIGRRLAAPPLDRLEAELGVVRVEEARRSMSMAGRCLLLRFGTRGWGTYDLPQYGLNRVTPDQVAAWTSEWFGAGNAALWMTGEPPPGLQLDLPAAPAQPEPSTPALPGRLLPAWTTHRDRTTAVSMLLARSGRSFR